MSINEVANKNSYRLFLNDEPILKETDPELVEIFENFAFDEVISYGNIDTKTRSMVILSSLVAMQTLSVYRVMLKEVISE